MSHNLARPPNPRRSIGYAFPIPWCLCLLAGCASAPGIQTQVERNIHGLVANEIDAVVATHRAAPANEPVEMTFEDAFATAVARDPEIKKKAIACQMAKTDIQQAKSIVWPRFTAELSVEVPIGGSDTSNYHYVGGGVFLRYNIMDAIFSADAVAASQAASDVAAQQQQAALNKLYYRVTGLCAKIDSERNRGAAAAKAAQIAQEAVKHLQALTKVDPVPVEVVRKWEGAARRCAWTREEAQQRFGAARDEALSMLGIDPRTDIRISDISEVLPHPENFAEDDWDFVKVAWQQRNDVRVAESELFMAEMRIVNAKRKRLPRPTAALGVGNMLLQTNQQAVFMPSLQVSMPLFDMGDVKRQVQKAKAERDIAEENLNVKARDLVCSMRNAVSEVRLAQGRLKSVQESLQSEQDYRARTERLVAVEREVPLTLFSAKLAEAEAELDLNTATYEFQRAALALKESRGDSPKHELLGTMDVDPK